MHEFALVTDLLTEVDRWIDNRREVLREVHLEVGPLSGVEPLLLESAFEQLKADSRANSARLVLTIVPLEARCGRCEQTFEPTRFTFVCPVCGGDDCRVVRGDGLILQRLVLDTDE